MAACRWKGVTRRSAGQPGAIDIAPAGLSACVAARHRQGRRHLVVTAADDGREAARTGPGGDGTRTWHAGTA